MIKKKDKINNRLDYYKNRDQTHPLNLLYEPPTEDFYGPIDSSLRHCTDYACIFIYLIFVGFTAYYAFYDITAYETYDFNRFFHGRDFRTDLCGKLQLESKPFQYFLDPDNLEQISICVEKCPSAPDYVFQILFQISFQTQQICLYLPDGVQIYDDYCYDTYYTDTYKNKYCMPMKLGARRSSIEKLIFNDFEIAKNIGGDFLINVNVIIWAFIIQIGVSVLYVAILLGKRISHVMLWTFIKGFCVCLAFIAIYIESEKQNVIQKECPRKCIYSPFKDWPTEWPKEELSYCQKQKMETCPIGCENITDSYDCARNHLIFLDVVRIILIVLIPIFVVLMIASFHKILRMIQVMDNMIKPIRQLPHILFIPFFVSILQGAFGVVYMYIYIGGVSSGEAKTVPAGSTFPATHYRSIEFFVLFNRGFYVVTFLYIWTLLTLYYYVRFFIACSASVWYYSRDKNYLNGPILRPMCYGLFYHMGSFLFGSLLLTVTWIFSAIFYFWKLGLQAIDRKNFILQVFLCISIPFFWIYEYFSKYISNRNYLHYVEMAVYGDNFWISGQKTHYLRIRNFSRVDMVKSTLGFVRIIGMTFISALGALMVYWILYANQINPNILIKSKKITVTDQQIEYPIVPTIFVFLTGLFLSQNFTSVIDVVAEVMVFDLIADEEMFMGKQRFADQDMLDFVNKYSKEKPKNEFDVTNKGKINPMNDNADANDDLYGADDDDGNGDGNGDGDGQNNDGDNDGRNQNLFPNEDDDFDPNKFKNGIDVDDLGHVGGNEEDIDYVDDVDQYNKQRVQDQDKRKKLKEDVIQLDKNKETQDKKKKKLDARRF